MSVSELYFCYQKNDGDTITYYLCNDCADHNRFKFDKIIYDQNQILGNEEILCELCSEEVDKIV